MLSLARSPPWPPFQALLVRFQAVVRRFRWDSSRGLGAGSHASERLSSRKSAGRSPVPPGSNGAGGGVTPGWLERSSSALGSGRAAGRAEFRDQRARRGFVGVVNLSVPGAADWICCGGEAARGPSGLEGEVRQILGG